jgi:hypothetical protein
MVLSYLDGVHLEADEEENQALEILGPSGTIWIPGLVDVYQIADFSRW